MSEYLKIENLVTEYSNLRLATDEDNQDILDFYKSETMNTKEESISFARDPDFFAFYRQTTNKFWTFLFLNDDKSIGGIATILRHIRYIGDKQAPVAYFCDLRVSKKASKRAKIQWIKFFPIAVSALPKLSPEEYCVSAYTAILSNNDAAINSLTKGGRGFSYRFLNKYYVQSFLTTNPLISSGLKTKEIDQSLFNNFYTQHNKEVFLSERPELIAQNIEGSFNKKILKGVYLNDLLIAIYIPIESNINHRLKVTNLKGIKKASTNLLKLLNRPNLNTDGELKTLDITHLCFDKSICDKNLKKIINTIIKDTNFKKFHIINFITTRRLNYWLGIEGLSFTTTGHLFEVHPESEKGILPQTDFRYEGAFL